MHLLDRAIAAPIKTSTTQPVFVGGTWLWTQVQLCIALICCRIFIYNVRSKNCLY
jgi:hypothetical protein